MAGGVDSANNSFSSLAAWFRGDTRADTTPAANETARTKRSPAITDGIDSAKPPRLASRVSNAGTTGLTSAISPSNAPAIKGHCTNAQLGKGAERAFKFAREDRREHAGQPRFSPEVMAKMTAMYARGGNLSRAEGVVALARAGVLDMKSPRVLRAIERLNAIAGGAAPSAPGTLNASAEANMRNVERRVAGWQGDVGAARQANASFAASHPEYADLLDDADTSYDDDQLTSTAANDATKTKTEGDKVVDPNKLGTNALRVANRRAASEADETGRNRKLATDGVVKQLVAQNIVDKRQAMTGTASEAIGAAVGALST